MANLNPSEVPAHIGVYYRPEVTIDDIAASEQESCLELLNSLGFQCVSGCIGARSATVGDLSEEAARDTVTITRSDNPQQFFTGPNPYVNTGIGIWTAP